MAAAATTAKAMMHPATENLRIFQTNTFFLIFFITFRYVSVPLSCTTIKQLTNCTNTRLHKRSHKLIYPIYFCLVILIELIS